MLVQIRALFVILNEHRQLLCNGLHLPGLLEYCMSWRPLQHAYLLFRCIQPCNAAHALAQPHSCKQWQTRSLQADKRSCQHTCNEVRGKGPPKWSKARVTVIPVNHREHQEYEISVQPQTCQGLTLQQQNSQLNRMSKLRIHNTIQVSLCLSRRKVWGVQRQTGLLFLL